MKTHDDDHNNIINNNNTNNISNREPTVFTFMSSVLLAWRQPPGMSNARSSSSLLQRSAGPSVQGSSAATR